MAPRRNGLDRRQADTSGVPLPRGEVLDMLVQSRRDSGRRAVDKPSESGGFVPKLLVTDKLALRRGVPAVTPTALMSRPEE
jgi:hypothetical protein